MGANLQARTLEFSAALRQSLINTLAWIPGTLAVIQLAARFPLARSNWRRRVPLHLASALLIGFVTNVLVVLAYWWLSGRFNGMAALVQSAAMWSTIRLHIVLLVYLVIAGITQGVLYYRRTRDRELQLARVEAQLARARLQALNAQIRPHFLFNTLHTIGQLWRSGRSEDADAMLDQLGSLFHRVSDSTSRTEVPLADELALVRDYLAIEQMRFRDRMQVTINAPEETLQLVVPPLILQPLVENAVRHGISRVSSAGRVSVDAVLSNGSLVLTVCDDGPGFTGPTENSGSGTGLSNTRERLAQLYGSAAGLDISQEQGTRVRITLPAHAR